MKTIIIDGIEYNLTPKAAFREGDWISGYYTNYKVLSVNNDGYLVEDVDGNKINILFENEKFHHIWTIQDAKDGDVLVSKSQCGLGTWYCIFKSLDNDESMTVYCYLARNGRFETKKELCFDKDPYNTIPATKEQRDLLFQKMHEAGYEWSDKDRKLIKIVK